MTTSQAYETIRDVDAQTTNGGGKGHSGTSHRYLNGDGSNHSNSNSSHHHHDDDDDGVVRASASAADNLLSAGLLRLVVVAAATAATLGYDVGIMAAAIQPLEREFHLTGVQKELAMGSLNFVAAAGALLGGHVANAHGRQPTVRVCGWLFVVGTVCMAAAPGYGTLLLGRVITGMGVGVSFVVAPVYLSEVAPTHLRGQLNTVFDVAINGGILLGYVVGFLVQVALPGGARTVEDDTAFVNSLKWRLMLGLGLVLPVVVLANLNALPESPRWLVMRSQTVEAQAVLSGLGEHPRQILRTVSSIQEELQTENSLTGAGPVSMMKNWSYGMWMAVSVGFWQQITGTEAVLYYSSDFLQHAGLQSATQRLFGNCFVGVCKLAPELIAMQVVDRIGRRPLMLGSAVSITVSLAMLATAFWLQWSPLAVVVLLCAVMASFSLGLGPFSFLIASENLGLTERAMGMTLCAATNRITSGLVALTAVSLYEAIGPAGQFTLYAAVGGLSLFFYVPKLQETSGQTLEQLAARNRAASLSSRNSSMQSPPPPLSSARVEHDGAQFSDDNNGEKEMTGTMA